VAGSNGGLLDKMRCIICGCILPDFWPDNVCEACSGSEDEYITIFEEV